MTNANEGDNETSDISSEEAHYSRQIAAFTDQVAKGAYSESFKHSVSLTTFFDKVMDRIIPKMPTDCFTIMDAGCGTGAWLHYLLKTVLPNHGRKDTAKTYGFDLTPVMVELATKHLSGIKPTPRIKVGSVLDEASYQFDDGMQTYNLVYSYDVVQQLPSKLQFESIYCLVMHTRPGGFCVIFDHDRYSLYGFKMAIKKFLTKRLGIPLLPLFYCNAKYPPLEKFRRQIERDDMGIANIVMQSNGEKRALIIQVPQTWT